LNEPDLLLALATRGPGYVPHAALRSADGRPRYTNRLVLETSPYLLQHAHNPVDWRPWGPEAFDEARRRDVPVFLSSGYSACHWCHVMAHESFDDEEIARFLNAHFVAVKLDREERPDVDACWMEVVQALTGHGGWPMTVFLTPSQAPLFAGTYFPARDGDRGPHPGFLTVLEAIARQWRDPRYAAQGAALMADLAARAETPASRFVADEAVLVAAARTFEKQHDRALGGFGRAPKFPRPAVLDYLLRMARRTGEGSLGQVVETTLDAMARGGLRDHVGGGFARYSTDDAWRVPHFEKMLYDNAQLVTTYLDAFQVTGRAAWAEVARDTLAFIAGELTGPHGGFLSALDADSEGEEGRFYVWTPAELRAALPADDAAWVERTFGVTAQGHLEGRSVLHLAAQLDEADTLRWTRVRPRLAATRALRPRPGLDHKVVTAWNGLAISAFARGARVLGEPALAEAAARAADFVLTTLRPDGRTLRAWCDRPGTHPAVLEDLAAMVGACLDLLAATHDPRWLDAAVSLQREQDEHFQDTAQGGYWRTAHDAEPLPLREKPEYDAAEPSGNALAAENLLRLHTLTDDPAYLKSAEGTLRALDDLMRRSPTAAPRLLCALDLWLATRLQIVIVGEPSARAPFEAVLRGVWAPHAVVVADRAGGALARRMALFEGRDDRGAGAAVYVCEGNRCDAPLTSPEALAARLRAL
jgi:uncharacterized protein YyaL (SSP411 family)